MGWLCAQCKAPHAEAFDACWQCGAPRAEDSPAVQALVLPAADQDEALPLSPEEEAVERAALAAAAARFANQALVRGDPSVYGRNGLLIRLRHARACYRARQGHPTTPPRADLDWLWAIAFAGGILSALGLAFTPFLLGSPAAAQVALYCMLGGTATGLVAAQWAAGREIAAAERGGWEPLDQG